MFGQEQQMQVPMLAALAAAVVLGLKRPDLASKALAAPQAGAVQAQLGYSRDFEREPDRVGLQPLGAPGYNPRAMAEVFQKAQPATRVVGHGAVPRPPPRPPGPTPRRAAPPT